MDLHRAVEEVLAPRQFLYYPANSSIWCIECGNAVSSVPYSEALSLMYHPSFPIGRLFYFNDYVDITSGRSSEIIATVVISDPDFFAKLRYHVEGLEHLQDEPSN